MASTRSTISDERTVRVCHLYICTYVRTRLVLKGVSLGHMYTCRRKSFNVLYRPGSQLPV